MPRIRLKICGITSLEEARAVIASGADAIGLDPVLFPALGMSGNAALADISLAIPPAITPVLLTYALTAGTIAQQVDAAAATAVQIVRPLSVNEYPGLKRIIRGRKIIQSIRVDGLEAVEQAKAYAAFADALHLVLPDTDDLSVCRQIVVGTNLPVFLQLPGFELLDVLAHLHPFAIDMILPRSSDGTMDRAGLVSLAEQLA